MRCARAQKNSGYSEREVLDADASFDWNELSMLGAAMSLFASRRVIDLRLPTGKPGKEGAAALIRYCQNPPPDTILLITCTQWSKAHQAAWVEAIESAGVFVPLWPLKPNELPDWIARRMAARGLKPDRGAIDMLAERIEGNMLAAAQEIDKLALLHGAQPLDAATLEALVADSARFDVFRLTDAALSGDAARALRILAGLRSEGEQVPPLLGWVLSNQLQLLARLATAGNNLGTALRNERVWLRARGHVSQGAGTRRACALGCMPDAQASRVDRISKGRGYGDAWIELERLLTAIAVAPARRLIKNRLIFRPCVFLRKIRLQWGNRRRAAMKPIAILGGTFDPVHIGHLRVAWEAAEALDARVRMMPSNVPPHRPAPVASAQQRVAMLKLALAGQDRLVLDTRGGSIRTGPSYIGRHLARAACGAWARATIDPAARCRCLRRFAELARVAQLVRSRSHRRIDAAWAWRRFATAVAR